MKKLLIALSILASFAINAAMAEPVRVQYTYRGQTLEGYLGELNYNVAANEMAAGAGFGFSHNLMFEPPKSSDASLAFDINAYETTFLFGPGWISGNLQLKYNESLFTSYTYKVNRLGFRILENKFFLFFDLIDIPG